MRKNFVLFFGICAMALHAEVIYYTPDNETVFPNPERGFTDQLGGEVALTDSKNHVVKNEEEWYWDKEDENYSERKNQSLVMLMYYLKNYKTKDLTPQILTGFDEDMQILRNHGFKCVLRFAYDWSSKNDASLQWVKRHLAQLKPHLGKNADVIYAMEAGFVGQWGEWYYSQNFGNETQQLNANRREVIDALLEACPENRFVLVRYPLIKTQYLGDEKVLSSEEAYGSTPRARIGHHNDAFLADWGNDGTYGRDGDGPADDPVLRAYIAAETKFVPNGGETNVESDNWAKKVYANAEKEMADYHWSFCGSQYSEKITDRWRKDGIYATLDRRLGYRFQLLSATLPEEVQIGSEMEISITLRNTGFAPLYNRRPAYLILRSDRHTYSLPLKSDPRRWIPETESIVINETPAIADSLAEGTYRLYLHLPDAYISLAKDPRYSVRFANEGVWDAVEGMNDLGASVRLVHDGSTGIDKSQAGVHPSATAFKILRDGHLFIVRNGQTYTLHGTCAGY